MDERVGLDEGAADDPRGAGELRPDRHAAHSVVMGGAESARLVQEEIHCMRNCQFILIIIIHLTSA